MNFVKISDERVPIPKPCIYNWSHTNLYPKLLVKIKGNLLFDLDEWERMLKEKIEENQKKKDK